MHQSDNGAWCDMAESRPMRTPERRNDGGAPGASNNSVPYSIRSDWCCDRGGGVQINGLTLAVERDLRLHWNGLSGTLSGLRLMDA